MSGEKTVPAIPLFSSTHRCTISRTNEYITMSWNNMHRKLIGHIFVREFEICKFKKFLILVYFWWELTTDACKTTSAPRFGPMQQKHILKFQAQAFSNSYHITRHLSGILISRLYSNWLWCYSKLRLTNFWIFPLFARNFENDEFANEVMYTYQSL